ncbi:MAG: methyltransferase family protein [Promethearchaeota archaeon]
MILSPDTIIVLFVLIFGLIHSVLARDFAKEKLQIISNYRRFYILVSLLTLVLLILIEFNLARQGTKIEVIIKNPPIGILFVFIGGFLFIGSMLQLRLSKGLEKNQLIKTGFFAFSRHPIYLGGIILLISMGLCFINNSVHMYFLLSLALYLFIGSLIEDYYLLRNVPEYPEYKKICGKYLPWRKKHIIYFFQNILPKKIKD